MARIKLDLPGSALFTTEIPVRITDINYGNHVGNDAIVSMLHEARVRWLKKNGYTELDIEGASLIQGDLAVEYLKESFYGDVLSFRLFAGDITRVSFDLYYQISCTREENDIVIARAKTGLVCFDYSNRKVMPIPPAFRALLEESGT